MQLNFRYIDSKRKSYMLLFHDACKKRMSEEKAEVTEKRRGMGQVEKTAYYISHISCVHSSSLFSTTSPYARMLAGRRLARIE